MDEYVFWSVFLIHLHCFTSTMLLPVVFNATHFHNHPLLSVSKGKSNGSFLWKLGFFVQSESPWESIKTITQLLQVGSIWLFCLRNELSHLLIFRCPLKNREHQLISLQHPRQNLGIFTNVYNNQIVQQIRKNYNYMSCNH